MKEIASDCRSMQDDVFGWAKKTFGIDNSPESASAVCKKLAEEVAELSEKIHSGLNDDEVLEEAADCEIVLLQVFGLYRGDVLNEVMKKMEKNKGRKWQKTSEGVFRHVE